MNEMIDRVAQACRSASRFGSVAVDPDQDGDPWRQAFIGIAKACIAEMREPTEAMRKAAYDALQRWSAIKDSDTILKHVYAAMIDAALKEE